MYDFNGFGQRVQQLRKAKGMTQEELADRVAVTGQAVSKWENDQSYPDITLIPQLAEILGTGIEHLFGKRADPPMGNDAFSYPDSYEGLPLVHSTATAACYSDKTVNSTDTSGVKFTDGSTAELSNLIAVNKGSGEIRFISRSDMDAIIDSWQHNYGDSAETTQTFEFGNTNSVDIKVLFNQCTIMRSADDKTRVKVKGSPKFIKIFRTKTEDSTLKIDFQDHEISNFSGSYKENQVLVEVPYEQGNFANVRINGSGMLDSEIEKFAEGKISVNGSGGICMGNFDSCNATINGSGNIVAKNAHGLELAINGSGNTNFAIVHNAKVSINGSGNIELKSAAKIQARINGSGDLTIDKISDENNDVEIKISGSGDININGGSCNNFNTEITGSGDVDASALTARNANIILHHSGSVTLGHVLEGSTEQIKRKGTIKILKRGNHA